MPDFDIINGSFSDNLSGASDALSYGSAAVGAVSDGLYSVGAMASGIGFGGAINYGNGVRTLDNIANTMGGASYALDNVGNAVGALSALGDVSNPAQAARLIGSALNSVANVVDTIDDISAMWSDPASAGGSGYAGGFNVGGPGSPYGNNAYGGGSAGGGGGSGGYSGGYSGGGTGGPGGDGRAGSQNWKVRVRCPGLRGAAIVFPITPNIQTTDTAKYSSVPLVHSNYAQQFYESSEVSAINISAEFPVQNAAEGVVLLSAISLFRAATKMFWGSESKAGTPPPLLFLDGYGGYFSNVPCVLISFTHTMPDDKDYIPVGSDRVPTQSTIQLTLQPVYSRDQMLSFKVQDIASGKKLGFI